VICSGTGAEHQHAGGHDRQVATADVASDQRDEDRNAQEDQDQTDVAHGAVLKQALVRAGHGSDDPRARQQRDGRGKLALASADGHAFGDDGPARDRCGALANRQIGFGQHHAAAPLPKGDNRRRQVTAPCRRPTRPWNSGPAGAPISPRRFSSFSGSMKCGYQTRNAVLNEELHAKAGIT
jgi:hypothetical protein